VSIYSQYAQCRVYANESNSGLVTTPNTVEFAGKVVTVGAFPIGIDPDKFTEGLKRPQVQERIKQLQEKFRGSKLIVGVDRLDYIKGVPQKLHTLQYFLETHPEWVGKVQLIQIAVPSRQDVEEYKDLRRTVNELVGRINGEFGSIEFNPVHLKHTSVPFDELLALYAVSDVCLISSTRDGMNLVAYEYIACQEERNGVLVLSEFAGVAQSLANGSIICNPWNTEELAEGIHEALTKDDVQRRTNYQKLSKQVNKYTSRWWGECFIEELTRISDHAAEKLKLRSQSFGENAEQKADQEEAVEAPGEAQEKKMPERAKMSSRSHTTV